MAEPPADVVSILVVDDHQMVAESLARLLDDEPDLTVVGVATGETRALELLRLHRPRVVLMDYQLGATTGAAVTAAMKQVDPEVTVVIITGHNDEQSLLTSMEAGCAGFVTKDRSSTEVVTAVRAAASGEAMLPANLLAALLPKLARRAGPGPPALSAREHEVLALLARGWTNKAIAGELHLSVNTVRNYVQSLLTKLGAHSKLEAVAAAVRQGVISYPSS